MLTPGGVPRKLRSMLYRNGFRSAPRWLLTAMVAFLVLGHVCELPAFAGLVVSLHSPEGRSADGHGHEPEMSCDPVDAVSNTTSVRIMGPVLEIAKADSVISSVPSGLVTPASIQPSVRRPSRPPLFLLYASLLI